MKRDRLRPAALDGLREAGLALIPLREPGAVDGEGRLRGKSPRDTDWTRRDYSSFDAAEHMRGGGNVGVRLSDGDLVVDVDPRNFAEGDDPLARLAADTGLDTAACPRVRTGSGGLHLYLKTPSGVRLRDTLAEYPGVEFKGLGRQVVAPGSVHPETGRTYWWDDDSPRPADSPAAPAALVALARRPSRPPSSGGGEHTQEEVAAMLDALRPEDFRDHAAWFQLMQACHHASAGDARQEFVEWSTRDALYAADAAVIGRRWDSLHADDGGPRVTYRTLHAVLRTAGRADAVPRSLPEDDFEETGAPPPPGDAGPERLGPLERTNETYCAVLHGGKFRVMYTEEDPSFSPTRKAWHSVGVQDFKNFLANRRVQRGEKPYPLADAWLEWPRRRTARGVLFDPERDHPGYLNLWTGWSVEPKRGDWSLLRELLWDALCDRDDALFEYVLDWSAHLAQRPGSVAEVALCFQGEKGTGKGTFARALVSLAGRHGLHVASADQLSGRFNAHLRDLVVLFADEALRPGDRAAENRLKALVTEPTLGYEGKGRDVESGRNFVRVIMATNDDWFLPHGLADDERRFVVQRASRRWKGNTRRFEELNAQLRSGGLAALLWDLLARDVSRFHPRDSQPRTAAAVEQAARNLGPVGSWWLHVLEEGAPPGPDGGGLDWSEGPLRFLKEDARRDFGEWSRDAGIRAGASGRGLDMLFAREIQRLCPGLRTVKAAVPDHRLDAARHGDGRAWAYEVPDLSTCRAAMETALGGDPGWPDCRLVADRTAETDPDGPGK